MMWFISNYFSLPLDETSKRYLVFEEFSKELSFYASSTMTSFFFFLGAMSEKGILKGNSVAVIKRKLTTYKSSFMWKKLVLKVRSGKDWEIDLPKPTLRTC